MKIPLIEIKKPNVSLALRPLLSKPIKPKPALLSWQLPDSDPCEGVDEGELVQELGSLGQAFKKRMQEEAARKSNETDRDYYFTVSFTSPEQKKEFLKSMNFSLDLLFMDGRDLAEKLNIPLSPDAPIGKLGRISPDFAAISLDKE